MITITINFKGTERFMSAFLDAVTAQVKNIHINNGVTVDEVNSVVTTQVNDAIQAAVAPIEGQVSDLQTAINEILTQLTAGNTGAAIQTAQTAANQPDSVATSTAAVIAATPAVNPPVDTTAGAAASDTVAGTAGADTVEGAAGTDSVDGGEPATVEGATS